MSTGSKPKQYRQSTKCKMLSYQTFQGGKKKAFLKAKIEELETKIRSKILRTCIEASMTLRRVTSLELI